MHPMAFMKPVATSQVFSEDRMARITRRFFFTRNVVKSERSMFDWMDET